MMTLNYYQSSPDYDASQETLDLANNCLDILENIRQNNFGNADFFQALLNGIKDMSMEIHMQCFVTYSTRKTVPQNSGSFPTIAK